MYHSETADTLALKTVTCVKCNKLEEVPAHRSEEVYVD